MLEVTELANDPAMVAWIESFPDQAFARDLVQFIEDYGVVGHNVAGIHVVEGLEGAACVLREMGWGNEIRPAGQA